MIGSQEKRKEKKSVVFFFFLSFLFFYREFLLLRLFSTTQTHNLEKPAKYKLVCVELVRGEEGGWLKFRRWMCFLVRLYVCRTTNNFLVVRNQFCCYCCFLVLLRRGFRVPLLSSSFTDKEKGRKKKRVRKLPFLQGRIGNVSPLVKTFPSSSFAKRCCCCCCLSRTNFFI